MRDEKKDFTNSVFTRYIVAVLSAFAAEAATYPLDLMKTRLQIQSEVASAKAGLKLVNKGLFQTAIGIVRDEGPLKLWSGVTPMLQRHVIYAGCKLVFYEKIKRILLGDGGGEASLGVVSLSGVSAGSLAQLMANPADLVKVKMQAEGRRILQGKKPKFTSSIQAYKLLYRESGLTGFFRGAIPNMQRAALVNLGDLAAYDYTKRFLMREYQMADNALLHCIAAFFAGFIAAVMGSPADVLKTRLMNQPVGPDGKGALYRGMMDCLRVLLKNEGALALYKGFIPLWIRLGPWALINWVAFENIMIAIGGKTF